MNSNNGNGIDWQDFNGFDGITTSEATDTNPPHAEWMDEQYFYAIDEIIANHSPEDIRYVLTDAHWTADMEKKAMVLLDDQEQYVIPFTNVPTASKLYDWVEHLSRKEWIGQEALAEFVSVWQSWREGK
jgi:hypothetical protein